MIEWMEQDRRMRWIIPVVAGLLLTCVFLWRGNFSEATAILTLAFGALLLILALLTNISWYYYGMVALIPVSMDVGIAGGAVLSFPAEGLLLLLIPACFLFYGEYRKGLASVLTHPLTLLLLVDLAVLLFASMFSSHLDVSLKRVLIRALFFFGFFAMIQLFDNRRKLIYPWIVYALGMLPVMYFTLRNHIHFNFNPRTVFNICAPYFSDHTIYGACLAFIIPIVTLILLFNRRLNISRPLFWTLFACEILLLVSEGLALSRAALLSLAVAAVFALLLRYRVRFMHLMIGLAFAGGVIAYVFDDVYANIQENESVSNDGELVNHFSSVTNVSSDASNLERINRWICAWRMFEDKPLTGFGPGTYQFEYTRFQTLANKTYISSNTGDRGNAHSEYLTYLSETGIFGFLVFITIVFGSIYYGMQNHYQLGDGVLKWINLGALLGLITFYFHGLFNSFIDQSKMSFLVFTAIATIVWINREVKSANLVEE